MKLTRNHYPVRNKRERFFSADNDSYVVTKGGSHLKKVSENETPMYTLCTLNGKELDTGHSSSPNSELSYYTDYYNNIYDSVSSGETFHVLSKYVQILMMM
jgi:hypothetical protein